MPVFLDSIRISIFSGAGLWSWFAVAALVLHSPVNGQSGDLFPADSPLADSLLRRAQSLQEQHEHAAALPILRRALELARMSRGLYHEGQLDILYSLIESESVRANWEQVDDYFTLLQSLYLRLYADDPARLESGLARVSDWHADALRHGLDGRTVSHLRQARRLFKLRLQLAEAAPSRDPGKVERLRSGIRIAESHLGLYSMSDSGILHKQQEQQRELLLSSLR